MPSKRVQRLSFLRRRRSHVLRRVTERIDPSDLDVGEAAALRWALARLDPTGPEAHGYAASERLAHATGRYDGWIGVGFDGVLAVARPLEEPPGPPIPDMRDRVKAWLADGVDVRIVTPRVRLRCNEVFDWCQEHIGRAVDVAPAVVADDDRMIELWDTRAVRVARNRGIPLSDSVAEPIEPPTAPDLAWLPYTISLLRQAATLLDRAKDAPVPPAFAERCALVCKGVESWAATIAAHEATPLHDGGGVLEERAKIVIGMYTPTINPTIPDQETLRRAALRINSEAFRRGASLSEAAIVPRPPEAPPWDVKPPPSSWLGDYVVPPSEFTSQLATAALAHATKETHAFLDKLAPLPPELGAPSSMAAGVTPIVERPVYRLLRRFADDGKQPPLGEAIAAAAPPAVIGDLSFGARRGDESEEEFRARIGGLKPIEWKHRGCGGKVTTVGYAFVCEKCEAQDWHEDAGGLYVENLNAQLDPA